jgi:hypothetical protein
MLFRVTPTKIYLATRKQGDQIGPSFAFWVIVYFGQFFYYWSSKNGNFFPCSETARFTWVYKMNWLNKYFSMNVFRMRGMAFIPKNETRHK